MTKNTIPVTDCDGRPPFFRISHSDAPIWPIQNAEERASLQRLARLYSADLINTTPDIGACRATRSGAVVGLGQESWGEAELYAHLTRRRFIGATCPKDLDREEQLSVLISLQKNFSVRTMEQFSERYDQSTFPGLIIGSDHKSLRKQVLLRSAPLELSSPFPTRRIDFWPTAIEDGPELPNRTFLGSQSHPGRIRSVLAEGSSLVNIITHANGINAYFGSLTMCGLLNSERALSETDDYIPQPVCIQRGTCERLNIPIREALSSEKLFSPTQIRARILLLHVCFGMLFPTSTIHPSYGFLEDILRFGNVAACVTHWGVIFPALKELEILPKQLVSGIPLGQALSSFYKTSVCESKRLRPCLFGDPDIRLPPPENNSKQAQKMILSDAHYSTKKAKASHFPDFLTAYMTLKPHIVDRSLINRKIELVSLRTIAKRERQRAQRYILKSIMRIETTPSKIWMTLGDSPKLASSRRHCYICGELGVEYEVSMPVLSELGRRFLSCANCGIVDDLPVNFPCVEFYFRKLPIPALSLGRLHEGLWSARILIQPGANIRHVELPWPMRGDGRPIDDVPIPNNVPLGLSIASVFLMCDNSLVFLKAPIAI